MFRSRFGRITTWLAVVVAMALLVGACSNGDGDGDGGDSGSDSGESTRSTDGSALTDSDCQRYADAFSRIPDTGGAGNIDELQEVADSFQRAADEVPNEMSDDFRVIADAFGQFANALSDVDLDPNDPQSMSEMTEEDMAALQEAGRVMDDPAVQEAATDVTTFLEENCT